MNEVNIIKIASVEREFEAVSAVALLNDAGIAASYKPSTEQNIINLPGAMGLPDEFDIYVAENSADKASELLAGIGINISADSQLEATDSLKDADTTEESATPQTLNDLMPENPILAAIYKVVLALLALAAIGVFVWLCDTVIAWIIGLFR